MWRSQRGHMDLGIVFWILLILGAIAAEKYYEYATGNSLLSLVNWWWVAAGIAGIAALVGVAAALAYKPIRVETVDGRTVVTYGKKRFDVLPTPPEVKRWTTGGAFGQPLREWISLRRGEEVLYEGPAQDGERLLAALTQQPLAGGDAPKV